MSPHFILFDYIYYVVKSEIATVMKLNICLWHRLILSNGCC